MLRQVAASIAAVGRGPGQGKLCSLPLLAAERERIDRCLEDADAA
jgi:hypothetical protein